MCLRETDERQLSLSRDTSPQAASGIFIDSPEKLFELAQ